MLLLDQEGGFWLIHSVPGFPPHDAYSWPPNAQKYGQTLLCVSFPFDQFSKIGEWGQGGSVIPRSECGTVPHFLLPLPSRQTAELHLPSCVCPQAGRRLHQEITRPGGGGQGPPCSPRTLEQQCNTHIKSRGHLPELCQIWKVWRW